MGFSIYQTPVTNANAANTQGEVLSGNYDPSVDATDGGPGMIFLKQSAPVGVYQKQDAGITTNWILLAGAIAPAIEGVLGSEGAPYTVTLATDKIVATAPGQSIVFLASTGGPVTLTSDPPITDPYGYIGKRWTIIGESTPGNEVTLQPGAAFQINGDWLSSAAPTNAALTVIQTTVTVAGSAHYRTEGTSD